MVDNCANPECSQPFDYRQGRLYCCPVQPVDGPRPANNHGFQHYWLCGLCSETYTFERRVECGIVVTPRSAASLEEPTLLRTSDLGNGLGRCPLRDEVRSLNVTGSRVREKRASTAGSLSIRSGSETQSEIRTKYYRGRGEEEPAMRAMLESGLFGCALLVGPISLASAADKTWAGQISDSICGASHAKMIAIHSGAKMTNADCALACLKAGAKFVFVTGGNVYDISNQNEADLMKAAGRTVRLTGSMNRSTITVSKVAMPTESASKSKYAETRVAGPYVGLFKLFAALTHLRYPYR